MKERRDIRLKNFLIVVKDKEIIPEHNSCELYFYVNRLITHSWGQKVIRFYDPDGNLIEVGTLA